MNTNASHFKSKVQFLPVLGALDEMPLGLSPSAQQAAAVVKIKAWLEKPDRQIFRVLGYAGTGKTSMAQHAVADSPHPFFTALSGKAASVLREKGCADARHLHSFLYSPHQDGRCPVDRFEPPEMWRPAKIAEPPPRTKVTVPKFEVQFKNGIASASVIVVDEASMLNDKTVADLRSLGKPILALGDPAQLPPPEGFGSLTSGEPDVFLTEIHRQALDSPIIRLSMYAREGERLPTGWHGSSFVAVDRVSLGKIAKRHGPQSADQILCGRNETRVQLNALLRRTRGLTSGWPEVGEKLVALKNEQGDVPAILNGSLWIVRGFETFVDRDGFEWVKVQLEGEGSGLWVTRTYPAASFFARFDYGYVLTVHKAQGSEWPHVLVIDESFCWKRADQDSQWLYTAITRARERVVIVHLPWRRSPT